MYQKWPNKIFPLVDFVFSHDDPFGLEGGGGLGEPPPPPGTQKSKSLCTKTSQINISFCKFHFSHYEIWGSEGGGASPSPLEPFTTFACDQESTKKEAEKKNNKGRRQPFWACFLNFVFLLLFVSNSFLLFCFFVSPFLLCLVLLFCFCPCFLHLVLFLGFVYPPPFVFFFQAYVLSFLYYFCCFCSLLVFSPHLSVFFISFCVFFSSIVFVFLLLICRFVSP